VRKTNNCLSPSVREPNESRRRLVDDFGVTSGSYDPANSNVADGRKWI
jgi:hypothetical protein